VVSFKPRNDNGAPIKLYDIQVEDVVSGEQAEVGARKLDLDAHGFQYFGINHLRPGVEYRFRARVSNVVGESDWSDYSSIAKTEAAPPEPVDDVEVVEIGPKSFKIAWKAPLDNGDPIKEYCVQWTADEDFHVMFKEWKTDGGGTLTALCDGLTPGSRYFARVAASNGMGYGEFGRGVQVDSNAHMPDAPARPRIVEVGPMHAKISWMVPYDCGKRVTNFWLRFSETAKDGRPEHQRHRGELLVVGRRHSCVSDLLLCEREYTWEIAAENELGLGPYSTPSVPARTLPPSVPTGMVSAPTMVSSTPESLMLRWTASEPMGADITEQILQVSLRPTFEEGDVVRELVLPPWDISRAPKNEDGSPRVGLGNKGAEQPDAVAISPTSPSAVQAASAGMQQLDAWSAILFDTERDAEARRHALEEKRKLIRKAVASKIGALVSQFLLTAKEGDYEVENLRPGTGYYARVASRNKVGVSVWSPISELMATGIRHPDKIPEDPGILCLRSGCTTLTFGWKRPVSCHGAPVTHYIVRLSESEAELQSEDCHEFEHEELERESWDGMVHPAEEVPPLISSESMLHDEEAICTFVSYVLVRFGSLQECWEWLDVNANGRIAKEEFIEGDIDHGAPLNDFQQQELLPRVWQLLDADAGGTITMNEFNKLGPYMDKVRVGGAGLNFKGVFCLCPGLIPGKPYYLMACAVNKVGRSGWTQCLVDPCKTQAMSPSKMSPLRGVKECRTCESVTFRWDLPYNNGAALDRVEIRYFARNVEAGRPDLKDLREGKLVTLGLSPTTGELPTEHKVDGFLPGQIVFAIARCFNHIGGAREWSDCPGPGSGEEDDLITWDCSTSPTRPDQTGQPFAVEASMVSENSASSGSFKVPNEGRTNGLPFASLEFEIIDAKGEVVRAQADESSREETAEVLRTGAFERSFKNLIPGSAYTIRARVSNAMGFAPWSRPSEVFKTPPDKPHTPQTPMLESTSLKWIELKWFPPYANGAPITEYDIIYSVREDWPLEDWSRVPQIEMLHGIKEHGHDGRRSLARDRGSLIFRLENLAEFTMHYFRLRCRNIVGWSGWSEIAAFKTQTVEPSKVNRDLMEVLSVSKTSLKFRWTAPECNGEEITRFDVLGSSNYRLLKWATFVQLMLRTAPDPDKLYGYAPPGGMELGDITGTEGLDKFINEEITFSPISPYEAHFELSCLMPGQEYFFSMRALNKIGKGELSAIFGPIKTHSDSPAAVAKLEILETTDRSARFTFPLPWNSGSTITALRFKLQRVDGPLASHEVHPETEEPHPHLASREWAMTVDDCSLLDRDALKAKYGWVAGTTSAVLQAFKDEGATPGRCQTPGHVLTTADPTGFRHTSTVDNLLPGTHYEIAWACRNKYGWSEMSSYAGFETEANVPDQPGELVIGSL